MTWLYGYGNVEKINGRVKKLTERYFSFTFNKEGDLVKIEDLFKNGIDTTKYSTIYNKDNRKIESIGLYFEEGKKIREIFKYDIKGHMTIYIGNTNALSPDTDRFFYDKAGNLIEQQIYFEKKPLWTYKFRYLYNKSAVCTGIEQSTATWHDNFKTFTKDTTRYIVFDSKYNWLKAIRNGDTLTRKITYY